jgi:hypothetical protein
MLPVGLRLDVTTAVKIGSSVLWVMTVRCLTGFVCYLMLIFGVKCAKGISKIMMFTHDPTRNHKPKPSLILIPYVVPVYL